MSMLDDAAISKIADEAVENFNRLQGCPGPRHLFLDTTPGKMLGKRYRCQVCAGEVNHHAYHWYLLGLEHAMKGKQ
jgi:hypothetical protein